MNMPILSLLNTYGGSLCAEYRYDDAEIIFRHALSINDSIPEINKNLGDCCYGLGRFQDAVKYLRRAISLRSDYHRAYGSLGAVLRAVNKSEEALRIYDMALSYDKHNTYYKLSIAMCYIDLNLLEKAEKLIVELAEANLADLDIAKAHSIILSQKGEMEKASNILHRLLKTEKYKYSAFSTLSEYKDLKPSEEIIQQMEEEILKGKTMSRTDEKLLCFGLWRVFDREDQRKKAFYYLKRGNDLVRNSSNSLIEEEIAFLRSSFKDLLKIKDITKLQESTSVQPVFIVGMPRSGSSLVEQILSAHTAIKPSGETMILPRLIENYKLRDRHNSKEILQEVRNQYLLSLEQMTGVDHGIVSDKTLSNFMNINLILAIFPHAKIIHIKRGAMDNCFACYATDFKNGHFYTSDLTAIGEYYKAYINYVKLETTGIQKTSFIEVDYESITMNMQSEMTRIFEFIGLKWQDGCSRFFESKNHVATASYYDVRKQISTKSVNRWSRYAEYLKPLSDVIETSRNQIKG